MGKRKDGSLLGKIDEVINSFDNDYEFTSFEMLSRVRHYSSLPDIRSVRSQISSYLVKLRKRGILIKGSKHGLWKRASECPIDTLPKVEPKKDFWLDDDHHMISMAAVGEAVFKKLISMREDLIRASEDIHRLVEDLRICQERNNRLTEALNEERNKRFGDIRIDALLKV